MASRDGRNAGNGGEDPASAARRRLKGCAATLFLIIAAWAVLSLFADLVGHRGGRTAPGNQAGSPAVSPQESGIDLGPGGSVLERRPSPRRKQPPHR